MSMLKPNDNTILWTQILEIPRHVTRAFGNLEQGGGNGLAMDAKARENRRNVRGWNTRNRNIRNVNIRTFNKNETENSTIHSNDNDNGKEAIQRVTRTSNKIIRYY